MNQFTFEGREKSVLIGGMVLGLVCLALSFFMDGSPHAGEIHSRFWTNFLHNAVFFTGIALMAGFFMCASITAWAGWYTTFKRVWESMSLFLIIGLAFMLFIGIGVLLGWNHLYHWADADTVINDTIINGKAGFLNTGWYLGGTIVFGGIWYFILRRIRSLSLLEEKEGGHTEHQFHKKIRVWAVAYLPLAGFGSAALVWLWIMSVDAHWYSTLFAWYTGASWFVSMICMTLLLLMFLKGRGYFNTVTTEHIHDIGKLLFAFSIFWTYLWFSQYMLIWYSNNGEETIYFKPVRKLNKPFRYNLSGLGILAFGATLENYIVFEVIKNSPAEKIGIQKGDIIKKIGWLESKHFSLYSIEEMLSRRPGKKIKFKIKRGEELLEKIIVLEAYIRL